MQTLQHPTSQPCARAYRHIQAHCAIRTSVRVGNDLRANVGQSGDIGGIADSILPKLFKCPGDIKEAKRLIELARFNTRRRKPGNE